MNTTRKIRKGRLLAGAAVTVATAALTFGAALPASAATGSVMFGARNLTVTPSGGGNFGVAGTTGTLTYDRHGGGPSASFGISPGDWFTWTVNVPAGLEFASDACAGFVWNNPSSANQTCSVTGGMRTLQIRQTYNVALSGTGYIPSETDLISLPVVSTGSVSGTATVDYTQAAGFTPSASPSTSLFISTATAPVGGLSAGTPGASGVPLTGTGTAGATVTVKDSSGSTVGTATVDGSGNWSVMIPNGTVPPLSITQSVGGVASAPVEFNSAPLPIVAPAVALGALAFAGLGLGGTALLRRTRRTATI
ncbi:Ig-like domain-containing protein [Leifsonia sp. RAF41]|uniref:Ig-like domain-containing protein n=1 Tax=Leifsonia sp. RAF41 TaxID=3233056 RepID=UPI003F96F84D